MEYWCNDTDKIKTYVLWGEGGAGLGSNPILSGDRKGKCHVHQMGETTWPKFAINHNYASKGQGGYQRQARVSFCSFM